MAITERAKHNIISIIFDYIDGKSDLKKEELETEIKKKMKNMKANITKKTRKLLNSMKDELEKSIKITTENFNLKASLMLANTNSSLSLKARDIDSLSSLETLDILESMGEVIVPELIGAGLAVIIGEDIIASLINPILGLVLIGGSILNIISKQSKKKDEAKQKVLKQINEMFDKIEDELLWQLEDNNLFKDNTQVLINKLKEGEKNMEMLFKEFSKGIEKLKKSYINICTLLLHDILNKNIRVGIIDLESNIATIVLNSKEKIENEKIKLLNLNHIYILNNENELQKFNSLKKLMPGQII